jgi:hypothetical protein
VCDTFVGSGLRLAAGCPALDTLFLAAMLAKRAPGYTGLGFSDPRKLALTLSACTADNQPFHPGRRLNTERTSGYLRPLTPAVFL